MDLLMNGLLMAATLFAGGYCWVLGRRVQDLKSLDRGLGGSIVTLTRQIELARTTLDEARGASQETRADLERLVGRADAAANQLRLLIAAAPVGAPEPRRPPVAEAPAAGRPVGLPEMPDLSALLEAPDLKSEPEPQPEPARAAPAMAVNLADVPKPRALAPVENPLRRAKGLARPAAAEAPVSEDAILEALSALAGRGR
jgi:hypothetical protein